MRRVIFVGLFALLAALALPSLLFEKLDRKGVRVAEAAVAEYLQREPQGSRIRLVEKRVFGLYGCAIFERPGELWASVIERRGGSWEPWFVEDLLGNPKRSCDAVLERARLRSTDLRG